MQQWGGIFKLKEEMAELAVILNKLCVFPSGQYPDGRPLLMELSQEMADVYAALGYFIDVNKLTIDTSRVDEKYNKFHYWGLSGVTPQPDKNYDTVPKEEWI